MTEGCKVCGAERMWLKNRTGDGSRPEQIDDHKQSPEIAAMIEEERIAREQERQVIEVPVITVRRRRKKAVSSGQ